jgi:Cys-tRNA(Pro)/Cys-tRNA(Cys) deacylase
MYQRCRQDTLALISAKATPATTVAKRAGIEFAVHGYDHDPRAPAYGLEAAERLGLDPTRVLKTLVATLDGEGLAIALVPVERELDVKALAAAAGAKRAALADPADAERATGYVVGGISPIGQRRRLPTFVDSSAPAEGHVYVSAGRRGLELELALDDLLRVTGGRQAAIAR